MTNEELQKYSGEHIKYEIEMLFMSVYIRRLEDQVDSIFRQGINNVSIESFAIHLRNVTNFLYDGCKYKDDICAELYEQDPGDWKSIRPVKSENLVIAQKRASKQVAHLTTRRVYDEQAEYKNWEFVPLIKEIVNTLELFVDCADEEKLSPLVTFLVQETSKKFLN